MITIDKLKTIGVDTDEGIRRCMGNETLYLKLVAGVPSEACFSNLDKAVAEHDFVAAFEAAHAMKGILGNLAIKPMFNDAVEITELLRNGTDTDYSPFLSRLEKGRKELEKLCE